LVLVESRDVLADLLHRRNPLARFSQNRGMAWWINVIDWVGGYPFEFAKPEEVLEAVRPHGFELISLRTVQGSGNNEFLFRRHTAAVGDH